MKETMPSDARENDSAANRNTNATALQIIIDLSLYFKVMDKRVHKFADEIWYILLYFVKI